MSASPNQHTGWRGYIIAIAAIFAIGIGLGGWLTMSFGQAWLVHGDSSPASTSAHAAQPQKQTGPQAGPQAGPQKLPSVVVASLPEVRGAPAALRAGPVSEQLAVAQDQAARAEALLVAVAARRALDRGLSLGYIEPLLERRFGTSQPNAVQTIIVVSRKPATLENLRNRLERLEPVLVNRGQSGEANGSGFWAGVRRELDQLIVVRDANAPELLPSERVARALRLMDAGRVDAAILDVEALGGKTIAPKWLDDARRYYEARRALDVIETAALVESRSASE